MSKSGINPRTLKQASKVAGYHLKELESMAMDIGKQMMTDQVDWLDVQMQDILPPDLYAAGKVGEKEKEIGEYIAKHKIQIIFIPDSRALRIMIGNKVHSQFLTRLTLDGEPVKIENIGFMPDESKN